MSRFPRSEAEIAALALVVTQGLGQASDDFPTPPVAADELQARLDAYNAALSAAIGAETEAREQHAVKDDALEQLVTLAKQRFGTRGITLLGPRKVRERLAKMVAEQGLEIAQERER